MLNQAFLIYFFYTEKLTVTEFYEIFSNSFWDIWATDKHKWKRNLMVEIIRDLIFICMFRIHSRPMTLSEDFQTTVALTTLEID